MVRETVTEYNSRKKRKIKSGALCPPGTKGRKQSSKRSQKEKEGN